MKAQALREILLGQICLYAGLVVAILLKPQGLAANAGISYYGIYARTAGPMAAGLLGSAFFSWLAGGKIREPKLRPVRLGLLVFALLTILIVITPYSVSNFLDYLHTAAGSALFSLQLLLSFWFCAKLRYNFWPIFLTFVELAAGIACAFYLKPTHGFLIQGQTLFQLAFGILLIYSLLQVQIESVTRHFIRNAP